MEGMISALLFVSIASATFLLGKWLKANRARKLVTSRGTFPEPAFGAFTRPLAGVIPLRQASRTNISKELVASGAYHATAIDDFLAKRNARFLAALLLVAVAFNSGLLMGHESWGAIICGVGCLLIFSVPRVALSRRASTRTREIEKGIPDALDMIAMTVSSGMPVEQSVRHVAEQMKRTNRSLASELEIISRQSLTGSIDQAFRAFGSRVDLPEVAAWCAVMSHNHAMGGRIADSLGEYAARIRRDRKNRAERAGNTASLKLLLPVVTCLCPPIAIMLIGPALLDLRDFIQREKDNISIVEPLQRATAAPVRSSP